MEEEKQTEKVKEEGKSDSPKVDEAKEVLEKIQAENRKAEEILERLEAAKAEAVISGDSEAGSAAPEAKTSEEVVRDRANSKLEGTGLTI